MNLSKKAKLAAVLGGLCAGGFGAQAVSADNSALEEVIVTAGKRGEQNLQDVAISMSVLGGDSLDASSLTGVVEALSGVAGLNLYEEQLGGGFKPSMRGVTAGGSLFGGGNTVGYYIDDAPWGFVKSSIVPDANPYDLERVEVLRGPQGTLYGASALNGVIRVLTKDANLDEFDLKARVSMSSTSGADNGHRADMAINMPIIDGKLAARLVFGRNDESGWIDKPDGDGENANHSDSTNWRLKIGAQPTEKMRIDFTASHSRSDYGAPSVAYDDGTSTAVFDEPLSIDYDLYGLVINYEFETFNLRSSTTSIDYKSDGAVDIAAMVSLDSAFDTKVFSQELNATSTLDGPWQWTAGLFYRDAEDGLWQNILDYPYEDDNGEIAYMDILEGTLSASKSFAVFGEISRRLMDDQMELTAGLRYFEDEVGETYMPGTEGSTTDVVTYTNVSPRLVLSWFPKDELTVYGSISEGFRSGQNASVLVLAEDPDFPSANEDTLLSYEVGAKGTMLNGRLAFDTAIYYMDWEDVQQSLNVEVLPTVYAPTVINGDSASGVGIDLDLTLAVTDRLQLGFDASWNDLTSDADVKTNGFVLIPQGERLGDSPETTLGLSFDYYLNLGSSNLEGHLSGSVNYHSELVSRSVDASGITEWAGDDMLITRLSFAVKSDNLTSTIFIDNAGDEDGATAVFPEDPLLSSRIRPRTVGVQFQYQY